MKAKLFGWTLLFLLMLPITPLFGQAQETNHPADKSNSVQSSAVPVDEATAQFEATKVKAETGDAQAQYNLADCYASGRGVAKDNVEALKWYRKAADGNNAEAQLTLGSCCANGFGVAQDYVQAYKWFTLAAAQGEPLARVARNNIAPSMTPDQIAQGERLPAEFHPRKETPGSTSEFEATKAKAETGDAQAQYNLGIYYDQGQGVAQDHAEAVKLYREAADQGFAEAQNELGLCYISSGEGLSLARGFVEAVKWFREAANQGYAEAQCNLGRCYLFGRGVSQDYVQAYKWFNLAAAQGNTNASLFLPAIALRMSPEAITEAERLSSEFKPSQAAESDSTVSGGKAPASMPTARGTGFFITDDGYLISNYHVVKDATKVRLLTGAGLIDAKVVQVDAANDLALLKKKAEKNGEVCKPLPIAASRTVALGGTVATVGFPDIGLQGFAPKLAKGEIASLSGAGDDPRYFQISAPVQPGNSGGALVDERGNVIGIVSAKLDAGAALAASGALPENVNYAVKSSLLLSFLESVPDVSAKLKAPVTADRKFEDVVRSAQDAAVLVLVY